MIIAITIVVRIVSIVGGIILAMIIKDMLADLVPIAMGDF